MTDTNELDAAILERRFDAPAEVIWLLWTDPSHFAAWYGPDGATIQIETMDVRKGGTRHVAMEMKTPNGTMRMWFIGEYLEVIPNERLVYTEAISDEHGNTLTPEMVGMPPGHPTGDRGSRRTPRTRRHHHDDAHSPGRSRRLARRHRLGDGTRQARRARSERYRSLTPNAADTPRPGLYDRAR